MDPLGRLQEIAAEIPIPSGREASRQARADRKAAVGRLLGDDSLMLKLNLQGADQLNAFMSQAEYVGGRGALGRQDVKEAGAKIRAKFDRASGILPKLSKPQSRGRSPNYPLNGVPTISASISPGGPTHRKKTFKHAFGIHLTRAVGVECLQSAS